jgi:hypothetical protein
VTSSGIVAGKSEGSGGGYDDEEEEAEDEGSGSGVSRKRRSADYLDLGGEHRNAIRGLDYARV